MTTAFKYKGYLFDIPLHLRWAVFLEETGEPWEFNGRTEFVLYSPEFAEGRLRIIMGAGFRSSGEVCPVIITWGAPTHQARVALCEWGKPRQHLPLQTVLLPLPRLLHALEAAEATNPALFRREVPDA